MSTLFGVPLGEIRNSSSTLSSYPLVGIMEFRDRTMDWNHHRVRSIAVTAVAEAGFAFVSIVSTMETLASIIAALVVNSIHFFIPNGPCKEDFNAVFCISIRNYTIVSLCTTAFAYVSLFQNCIFERLENRPIQQVENFFIVRREA